MIYGSGWFIRSDGHWWHLSRYIQPVMWLGPCDECGHLLSDPTYYPQKRSMKSWIAK